MARYFKIDAEYLYDAKYESPTMTQDYFDNLEKDFYETNKELIQYISSLGYDVNFSNHIDIWGKDGHPIRSFDEYEWEKFIKKMKLLTEYTILG